MEQIYLYGIDISLFSETTCFERAFHTLPPDRQNKITRYRIKEDRLRSLAAGCLLACAIKQQNIPADTQICETVPYKKPYLPACPDFHFNLSHSGTYAICAVAGVAVGCDIEKNNAMKASVARRFFTANEQKILEQMEDPAEKQTEFFRMWTIKESYLKMKGTGFYKSPDSFDIRLTDHGERNIYENETKIPVLIREFSDFPGYCCSLCREGDSPADLITKLITLEELNL